MTEPGLYDISPLVSPRTAVFPGDTPFQQKIVCDFSQGDNFFLSTLTSTPHVGAHCDSPRHYSDKAETMETRSLKFYFGKCQVIHVSLPRGERIMPLHLKDKKIEAPRVLFRTQSFPDPDRWNDDFNSLSPELIEKLHGNAVTLVGIDTPSVDPATSKALESHAALAKFDMSPLEGIVLDKVPEGCYFLMALPLKLEGADASPVRAVLVSDRTLLDR